MTGGFAALLVLITALVAAMAGVAFYIYYGRLIMRSKVAGAPVGFERMVRMTLSGLDVQTLVIAYLDAHTAGIHVPLERLESLAREKGDPRAAVKKMIAAKASGVDTTLEESGLGAKNAG